MRLPSISNDQASIAWNAMANHDAFDAHKMMIDSIGDDDDDIIFGDLDLEPLCSCLADIKAKYADKNKKTVAGALDAEVIEPLHKILLEAKVTPFQLSQLGFWRWLSNIACNGHFWRFIKWRFEGDQLVNWGITSQGQIIEVYFYRAWLRAHKMFDASSLNPYRYATIGSSDVWRSHILRQDFGRDRDFVKAFLDTIYDDNGITVVGTQELRTNLIPALRAWTSNSTYSHLSYKENLKLIANLRSDVI